MQIQVNILSHNFIFLFQKWLQSRERSRITNWPKKKKKAEDNVVRDGRAAACRSHDTLSHIESLRPHVSDMDGFEACRCVCEPSTPEGSVVDS